MSIDVDQIVEYAKWIENAEIDKGNADRVKACAIAIKELAKPRKSVSDCLDENTDALELLLVRAEAIFEGVNYFGTIVRIFDGETSILSDGGVTVTTFDDDVFPDFDSPKMVLVPENQPEDERITAWDVIAGHKFFNDCYLQEEPLLEQMLKKLDEIEGRNYPLPNFVRPAYHSKYGYGFVPRHDDNLRLGTFFGGNDKSQLIHYLDEDMRVTYLDQAPVKLSTQQDYKDAPVGAVVKSNFRPHDTLRVFIKINKGSWLSTVSCEVLSNFQMSGDIREVVTVIEAK